MEDQNVNKVTPLPTSKEHKKSAIVYWVEMIIFEHKWILNFFYIGLIIGLLIYAWLFAKTLFHTVLDAPHFTKEHAMLVVLELVDMVMVANLVKMIITGSYNSFVSKGHGRSNENISSGILKIKMSTSLIGVSSIHLLQTFLDTDPTSTLNNPVIVKQFAIHGMFLVGAVMLAVIEYLHDKGEALHAEDGHNH